MILTITDIILIILILGVLYLLYSPDIDHFINETDISNAINEEINNRYLVNLTNMRSLNGLINEITNNLDTLNITQSNTQLFDINTNDMNINNNLNVTNLTSFKSDVSIKGLFIPPTNKLQFKNTNITNKIKINPGRFNDIFPKGSILLFNIKDTKYNIPYGWVPCDGTYYDVVQTPANNFGKDENGYYATFYIKSEKQPRIRNLDLAHEMKTFIPHIDDLIRLQNIGLDKYEQLTGVHNNPFTEKDLQALSIYNDDGAGDPNYWFIDIMRKRGDTFSPKKGLSSEPIKRDYIYIRKII